MAEFRNQIVGLVRFSYPAKGGFAKADGGEVGAHEAQLYDADRLARRFHLFETLTMPSLLAQTDPHFQVVFLIGKTFPTAARDRLAAAIAPLKGARIVPLDPMFHYSAVQRAFSFVKNPKFTHFTSFRLDDDDALDIGFIARLRRMVATVLPVSGPWAPLVVGHNHGFFLRRSAAGNQIFDVVERTPIGIGLAMTVPMDLNESIFRRNHRQLGQYYNTFTDAEVPAFIRTVHDDNDSDPTATGRKGKLAEDQIAAAIAAGFPFTMAQLLEM